MPNETLVELQEWEKSRFVRLAYGNSDSLRTNRGVSYIDDFSLFGHAQFVAQGKSWMV